jgi:hypothetical protein
VLAATGLLDGLVVATHWCYAALLQSRFPRVRVDASILYSDHGRILTSAGTVAGIDACLHIVRSDHGAEIANRVARRMVVAVHRDGGQAQFIESRGIGAATCRLLAANGTTVVINGRDSRAVEATVEAIHQDGGTAIGIVVDVSDAEPLDRLRRETSLVWIRSSRADQIRERLFTG